MENELLVRDFGVADQGPVRALILAGLRDHWGEIDDSLNPDLEDIARSYRGGRTVVVEWSGRIVGTGTLVPRGGAAAEIVRMSVDAGARGRGIGRRIVEELLATAQEWNTPSVVLETTAHWDDAVAFYLACGFRITHHEDGAFGRGTWFEYRL